jgi:hypothetical protein
MHLDDFYQKVTSKSINKLLAEHFDVAINIDTLTVKKVRRIRENAQQKINAIRNSHQFHVSEKNPKYLSLIALENLLSSWIRENNPLMEEDSDITEEPEEVEEASLTHGASRLAHGVGAVAGAFAHGVAGKPIHSDWGKVHQIGDKLPKNTNGQTSNLGNKPKLYASQITQIKELLNGPEFKNLSPEGKEKIRAAIFAAIGAKQNNSDVSARSVVRPSNQVRNTVPEKTQVEKDVFSAMVNQGYDRKVAAQSIDGILARNPKLANNFNALFAAAIKKESKSNNKPSLAESKIIMKAKQFITEGELENAEATLAAKDLVDRLQDMVEELGKMSNEELPHLNDAIRNSFGQEAATSFQTSANDVLTSLLTTLKEKKSALENATLTLTGESTEGTDLSLPGEEGVDTDATDALDTADEIGDEDSKLPVEKNPLGRETRPEADFDGQESRKNSGPSLTESVAVAKKKYETAKTRYARAKETAALKGITRGKSKEVEAARSKMDKAKAELDQVERDSKKSKLKESDEQLESALSSLRRIINIFVKDGDNDFARKLKKLYILTKLGNFDRAYELAHTEFDNVGRDLIPDSVYKLWNRRLTEDSKKRIK